MALHRVTMAKSRQNLAKSRPLVAIEQQGFIYKLYGFHGVFHVGNVWIRPWANFAQYMDPTFKKCEKDIVKQDIFATEIFLNPKLSCFTVDPKVCDPPLKTTRRSSFSISHEPVGFLIIFTLYCSCTHVLP